eukprot:11895517-Prorocentrum_lima.AAC.1
MVMCMLPPLSKMWLDSFVHASTWFEDVAANGSVHASASFEDVAGLPTWLCACSDLFRRCGCKWFCACFRLFGRCGWIGNQ